MSELYPLLVMGWEDPDRTCVFVDSYDELYAALAYMMGESNDDDFDYNKNIANAALKHLEDEGSPYRETIGECAHLEIIANCYCEKLEAPENDN